MEDSTFDDPNEGEKLNWFDDIIDLVDVVDLAMDKWKFVNAAKLEHSFLFDPSSSQLTDIAKRCIPVIRKRLALMLDTPACSMTDITCEDWFMAFWDKCNLEGLLFSRVNAYLSSHRKPICSKQELIDAIMAAIELSAHGCSVEQAMSDLGKAFFNTRSHLSKKRLMSILQGPEV